MSEEEGILFRKGVKIQDLNRIAIPKELLENVDLNRGDRVQIFFNPKNLNIIIKKDKEEKDE